MRTLLVALALAAAAPAAGAEERKIDIKVTDAGFEPREVKVKRGQTTTLVFTRVTERTCITAIDIPAEKVSNVELPLHKPVSIAVTPQKAGVERFHCSAMAMGNGRLVVGD